ncbi:MAG: SUMF1/EgtB/PvdO family nonheme iron enzyme, partial [Deltaproteobacteria bacterium]|nr:SUMF1/EgtB/PvdO family nonheme iron enzyme [Deltaproteobacteria bacterium]
YIAAADPASRPTLRDRGVETTDAVEAVLARAMAVEPADRYADAGSFWDALCEAAFAEAEPAPVPEPADVSDTGEFVARHDLEIDGEPASATARREAAAAAATAGGAAAAVAIARADAADADALARASADDLADAVADAVADADAGTARAQRDAGAAHGRTAETPTEVEPAPGSTGPRPARWPLLLAVAAVGAAALLYVWSRPTAPDAAEPAAGTGRPEAAASGTTAGRARSGLVPTPPGSNLLADGPPTASATVPLPARDAGSPDGAASDAATASATAGPALAPVPPPGMVFVPGGADAGPSTGFFIDRTEVSTGDYRACVRAGRCPPAHRLVITEELAAALSGGGAREGAAATPEQLERAWEGRCNETREALDHPINCVNHPSAEDYCRFVRRRLPTSAEWTRAAAGAEGRRFPWGAEPPQCNRSCYGLNASCLGRFEQVATCAVGTHPRDCTPEGALDLGGNVSEWVADVFPAPGGPSGPARRLVRGGSFVEEASGLETGALNRFSPVSAHVTIGFRCALDAPAPAAPAAGTRR